MIFKGYVVPFGYMGLVEGHYILFATEDEYYEYLEEFSNGPESTKDRMAG